MSGQQIGLGDVLRSHSSKGYTDLGRVVWLSKEKDAFWLIPFPRKPDGKKAVYIKAPVEWRLSKANECLRKPGEGGVSLSAIAFKAPAEWSLSDEELSKRHSAAGLSRKSRRNLQSWRQKRDADYKIIEPIILANDRYVLIEMNHAPALAALRAAELGVKTARVLRILRLYMMGWGERNCLLPGWANCGNAGTKKFCETKTGRPSKLAKSDRARAEFACQQVDRDNLAAGYQKYKVKAGYSVPKAYLMTMDEFYCSSFVWLSPTKKEVVLLPKVERPTYAEFKAHGPGEKPEHAAARVNLGVNFHERNGRALPGSARDGMEAFGQCGWIDSTSEDQTPVSCASRLKVLPSTSRTMVKEGYTGYILGFHSGFEHPSVLTGLMALENCAAPKVEFCKPFGIDIAPGDWHSFMPKRVRGDNGDLKGEKGIQTLSQAQITLEIVRSKAAEMKGPIEAEHKSIHRAADHTNAGSTKGRKRRRDEPKRENKACRTHFENMHHLIRAVLWRNNVEPVRELLTLEMRNDGVEPTRKAILEWMIDMGYVVSEPIDLDHLRAQCLPRLKAVIKRDGIHVRDPQDERQFIPGLIYWCDWIQAKGLTERGGRRGIETEILLNPSYLSIAWIYLDGSAHRLELKTKDEHMQEVSLCDWMSICEDDSLRAKIKLDDIESQEASRIVSNEAQNQVSAKAKQEEAKHAEAIAPKPTAQRKRQNAAEERELLRRQRLGLVSAANDAETDAQRDVDDEVFEDDLESMLMARLRSRRAA